jgi:putative ABC transport system permease protein
MSIVESFRVALNALRANKFRSTLTMLGIVIGVSSVILLVSIGAGVRNDAVGQIEDMGSNLLFVFPGKMEGMNNAPAKRFTMNDYEYLKSRLPDVEAVVGIFQANTTVKAGSKTQRTMISSTNDADHKAFVTKDIAAGRLYRRSELSSGAKVVTLGWKVAKDLFGSPGAALGKTVSVNGQKLKVVGVMAEQGGSVSANPDTMLHMPVTTALKVMGTNDLSLLAVKVADPREMDVTKARIERALKPRFRDDLSVYSQKDTAGAMDRIMGVLTVMLAGIAGISLLVGGIGIMNIMLVSVSERTREIGIRKAVGARTWDVLGQFVIEAIVLSVLGGLAGIALGVAGAFAVRPVIPTSVESWSAISAFLFSAAIGVFFGVYPASKAARLQPIVALRHE